MRSAEATTQKNEAVKLNPDFQLLILKNRCSNHSLKPLNFKIHDFLVRDKEPISLWAMVNNTAYTQNPKPNWAEAPPLHKTAQDAKGLKSDKAAKL